MPPRDSSSPYSPSRPTQTLASPASVSLGERPKPPGTWAARDSGNDGNVKQNVNITENMRNNDPSNHVKMNETFTPPDNQNVNVCRSFNNHNIYNNDSGRLVNYSGSEPESEEEQDRNELE